MCAHKYSTSLLTQKQGVYMIRIIMCLGLFCINALVTGKENVVSQPLTICGTIMDDPYPMDRMSSPVANARVELRTPIYSLQGTTDSAIPLGPLVDSAITGTDGKFCLKNATSGNWNVIITHPEYRTRQISLFASKDTTLNIPLVNKNAVSSISGTVTTTCTNSPGLCTPKPVPGCSLLVSMSTYAVSGFAPVTSITISAVTDAEGNYQLKNIPLSYNGEKVDVLAKKSGISKIAVATLTNLNTTIINFSDFPANLADDSSFQVSPPTPTSVDSILFRFFNANDCCCTAYKNMSVSVVDSTINIYYSLDSTPCLACGCMGQGKWAAIKYQPLKAGRYNVYKSHSIYCPPGIMCPAYMTAPVLLGSLIVKSPTGVSFSSKENKKPDTFTFNFTGTSVKVNLGKNSHVILKAFNVNGSLLGELYNNPLSAGTHNITVNNLNKLVPANGLVILKMTVDGVTKAVKRITTVRMQ